MAATETSAAIRPYSIAVAPDSFLQNCRSMLRMSTSGRVGVPLAGRSMGAQDEQSLNGSEYSSREENIFRLGKYSRRFISTNPRLFSKLIWLNFERISC